MKKKTTFAELLFEVGGGKDNQKILIDFYDYDEEDAYNDTVLHGLEKVWDVDIEEFFREKFGKQKSMW